MQTEFSGLKSSMSILKEHFKALEQKFVEEVKQLNDEVSQSNQNQIESYEKLNDRQSKLDEELQERFRQLDVQNVKIAQVEGVMESYREEVNYLKNFCQQLDISKTDVIDFKDHTNTFEDVTRNMKVKHDSLGDRVTNIENF